MLKGPASYSDEKVVLLSMALERRPAKIVSGPEFSAGDPPMLKSEKSEVGCSS